MSAKCFGCGKYVKLGEGKVTKATRPDGFIQLFCEPCVTERVEYKQRERGIHATFSDYIGPRKTLETV